MIDNFIEWIVDLVKFLMGLAFLIVLGIGYLANLSAVYHHWDSVVTIGHLAELIGIVIFPIGIITGYLYIL
jgi:hypothetical protein